MLLKMSDGGYLVIAHTALSSAIPNMPVIEELRLCNSLLTEVENLKLTLFDIIGMECVGLKHDVVLYSVNIMAFINLCCIAIES